MLTRKILWPGMNRNRPEPERIVHTHWASTGAVGREGLVHYDHSSAGILPEYFRLSGFQSLLLLIHFHCGPKTFSNCTEEWHRNRNLRNELVPTMILRTSLSILKLNIKKRSVTSTLFANEGQLNVAVQVKPTNNVFPTLDLNTILSFTSLRCFERVVMSIVWLSDIPVKVRGSFAELTLANIIPDV